MITREDVEHISWLASIKISDEEKEKFVDQFNSILEYFHQLIAWSIWPMSLGMTLPANR